MFDFNTVKGIEALGPQLRRKFESIATQHMNCIENEKTRKKYELKSVAWNKSSKCFDVVTKGKEKYHYTLEGTWY